MPVLHNRINKKHLKEKILQDQTPRTTISFYRYVDITNPNKFRDHLYIVFNKLGVLGRIYIAHEGINAQISVPNSAFENFKIITNEIKELHNIRLNIAVDDDGKSFAVLNIKVRNKIVADGINDPNFSLSLKGNYVSAEAMNTKIENQEAIVVDMRNHYEYEVGHFEGAIEIPSDTFKEQLNMAVDMLAEHKDKPIIMYCTGGIRCEKASGFLKFKGFKDVYHLEGGIINYVHQIKSQNLPSKFIGKNFVFDNRLGERVTHDIISKCHQCGEPCDTHVNCAHSGCHLLFIQCNACAEKFNHCCSQSCADILKLPSEDQKQLRKGKDLGRNVFNKSKIRMMSLSTI
ncbi:MAG: rhodanese-related sulfurtransferase [Alphaproteobacteria bacterium]|nr:rhodanese-related sulfurtransferase [Alphaproteobacteria bacterium]